MTATAVSGTAPTTASRLGSGLGQAHRTDAASRGHSNAGLAAAPHETGKYPRKCTGRCVSPWLLEVASCFAPTRTYQGAGNAKPSPPIKGEQPPMGGVANAAVLQILAASVMHCRVCCWFSAGMCWSTACPSVCWMDLVLGSGRRGIWMQDELHGRFRTAACNHVLRS